MAAPDQVQIKTIKKFPETAMETEVNSFITNHPDYLIMGIEVMKATDTNEYVAIITYIIPGN